MKQHKGLYGRSWLFAILTLSIGIASCGGGNDSLPALDSTPPVVTLTSPVGGEVWGSVHTITWTVDDESCPCTSTVSLSSDSGTTYETTIVSDLYGASLFSWDTSLVPDMTTYRIQVRAKDWYENISDPASSTADFTVKNAPLLIGFARYRDINQNAVADAGDTLTVTFDLALDVNDSANPAAVFTLPVAGDTLGSGATMALGYPFTEVIITLGTAPHLHSRGDFASANLSNGDPSGIDISTTMPADAIQNRNTSVQTDARPSAFVDVFPAFVQDGTGVGNNATMFIVLVDMDKDGDLDLVEANLNQQSQIYLNDGTGSFGSGIALPGAYSMNQAIIADLNGDTHLDIVTSGTNVIPGSHIYLNNGSLSFTETGTLNDQMLFAGAVDAGATVDLIGGGDFYMNNGSGFFTASNQSLTVTGLGGLGDLDGDGDLDLVMGRVYMNDGTGRFSYTGQDIPRAWSMSDFEGDGNLDIVSNLYLDNQSQLQPARLWLNNGSGTFTDSGWTALTNHPTLHDIDGDGDSDLIGDTKIFLNKGLDIAPVDSGESFGTTSVYSHTVGDIDGDGDLDIVLGIYGGPDIILRGSLQSNE